jgi:hypothetical protein
MTLAWRLLWLAQSPLAFHDAGPGDDKMSTRLLKAALLATAIGAATIAGGSRLEAATFTSCVGTGYDISGYVSGATGCTIGSQNQDFLNTSPITVNEAPGYFGFTDWAFIKKDDPPVGGAQTGTYNVGNALAQYAAVMLIFKDGSDTTLVGYTVNTATGTWQSPFVEPPFSFPGNGPRDVSHISYYGRGTGPNPGPVPEPATLAILGMGLAGLGMVARRRRRA